ncbi:LysE family translocator [Neptunomonas antarctica]|uniref:Threonine/homoserine/homoserine lactone efflux protein n=1 Tax=Neptunomonas antarctica TaxID=619304 RepID=A0A1N7NFQ9_9GAMM|nr:LysE family translocator [Neptunomonas antarctica]SIS97194.1 Threonine/homoserine/homoserine lactone efflux protein [Neptunomonas antarctica]
MLELSLLAVFIPTFFFVSATPGMCMTLSMTMGMTIGIRRTLWMMAGELVGVGLVALLAVLGVATIMLNYPGVFAVFKYVGGAYLIYLGIQMWQSRGKMAVTEGNASQPVATRQALALQGFVTAVANPKGWAFFISLLPPFINPDSPLAPQLSILIMIILLVEFICLLGYASGGKTMRTFLLKSGNVRMMNRIAGSLMIGVGIWLAAG